jgi:hypothetical protein
LFSAARIPETLISSLFARGSRSSAPHARLGRLAPKIVNAEAKPRPTATIARDGADGEIGQGAFLRVILSLSPISSRPAPATSEARTRWARVERAERAVG